MADSMKDDGSIYSRATSTCPLLPADGDVASVTSANTSQPTAGKAVLTAFDPPVGILEGYTTREETVLEYEEAKSSVTGNDVVIRDVTHDKDVFIRHAKALHPMAAKEYRDAATDTPLMDIRFTWEAVFGHVKMLCKDSKSGDNLFMASSKTRFSKPKMKASFTNRIGPNKGELIELHVSGNWSGRREAKFERADTGAVPAVVRRASEYSMLRHVTASGLFHVTVAPGVDLALIAGLCNAWDENRYYG